MHTLQQGQARRLAGLRVAGEGPLGRRNGVRGILGIRQPHAAYHLCLGRVVEIEPLLTVRGDKLAIDVNLRNLMHVRSLCSLLG